MKFPQYKKSASQHNKERVHQTFHNIIHTFEIQEIDVADESLWEGIIECSMFIVCSTVYNTTQLTLLQLVFGTDIILNINQDTN